VRYKPQRTKLNDDHRAKLIAGFALLVVADFMQIRQPIEYRNFSLAWAARRR